MMPRTPRSHKRRLVEISRSGSPLSRPVLHGAVIPERSVEDLIHRWVLPKRFFPQLNTEARALGDHQIAMLQPERGLQQFALGRFRLARIFLQGKVGDTGIELDARGGADRREGVVRNHLDVLRLGDCGDLLAAGQATAQAHIRTDVGAALVLQQLLKLKNRGEPLASGNGDITALLTSPMRAGESGSMGSS